MTELPIVVGVEAGHSTDSGNDKVVVAVVIVLLSVEDALSSEDVRSVIDADVL